MRRFTIICSVAVSLVLLIFINDEAAARTSYTLVCRGGGSSMRAVFDMPQQYRTPGPRITISGYWRSQTPASVELPQRGSCAWTDRPFNNDEPSIIYYDTSNPGLNFIEFKSGSATRWSFNEQVLYIINAVVAENVFYLKVYRDGNIFRVTHVGP